MKKTTENQIRAALLWMFKAQKGVWMTRKEIADNLVRSQNQRLFNILESLVLVGVIKKEARESKTGGVVYHYCFLPKDQS